MIEKGKIVFNRQKLYEEIWKKSVSGVAKEYGISFGKLKSACKDANIPLPTLSYWGNKHSGKQNNIPNLPKSELNDVTIYFSKRSDYTVQKLNENRLDIPILQNIKTDNSKDNKNGNIVIYDSSNLDFLDKKTYSLLLDTATQISIKSNRTLHKVLLQHKIDYKSWKLNHPRDEYANWKDYRYLINIPKDEPKFWESVSEKSLPRLYLILDAIYVAIETLGGSVNKDLSLSIRGENVSFSVVETKKQVLHVWTTEEQKTMDNYNKEKLKWSYVSEPKIRKYDYIPTGKLKISIHGSSFFRDSDKQLLENCLGEILLELYRASENIRIEREKRETEIRRLEEEKRKEELRKQLYDKEVFDTEALKNEAEDYAIACSIRNYISALEAKDNLTDETVDYINWAKQKADWFDPTIAYEDPILGKREHKKNNEEKKLKINQRRSYFW